MRNTRERLLFYLALTVLGMLIALRAGHGAQVQSVGSTNDLALLPNPNTISSNTLVTTEGTVGDGTIAVWTWIRGTNAWGTNTVLASLTHPGEGVFVKQPIGGTGTGSGTNLWGITTGDLHPIVLQSSTTVTNLISKLLLETDGAIKLDVSTNITLSPGLNNFSPNYIGYLRVSSPETNPANATLRLASGNGSGQLLFIQNTLDGFGFTMVDNDILFGDPSSWVALNGDWAPTNNGDTLFLLGGPTGWTEVGRMFASTNGATIINNTTITTNLTVVSNITFQTTLITNITQLLTGFANPTASVGLTAQNGSATNAMRADAAPALDVSINPTWTGEHTYTKNVGAQLAVGATDAVDYTYADRTNLVSGAVTFLHATNGLDLISRTCVRWFFNSSGSDQTLTIPSGWRTNAFSAVPTKLTNGWITAMYCKFLGPTSSSALQTNVCVSFEYYH